MDSDFSNCEIMKSSEPTNIVEQIEFVAQTHPNKPALVCEISTITYSELNATVHQIALKLQSVGIKPERTVAVFMPRTPKAIVAFLAIQKAGGAYVPLDTKLPRKRLKFMLSDSDASVLICDESTEALARNLTNSSGSALQIISYSSLSDLSATANPRKWSPPKADQLAYIIYTSGSTGQPKGVMVEHRGLLNLVKEQASFFQIDDQSRVLQFASLGFDASISEILVSLCSGAQLHFALDGTLLAGEALQHIVRDRCISHITLPPSLASHMRPQDYESLKVLVVAGEAMQWALVERWSSNVVLINAYGPTENTVCATLYQCNGITASSGTVPIGKPIAKVDVRILGDNMCAVADGEPGTLWLSGVGLARGYRNQPRLTEKVFKPHPDTATQRIYNTGDRVRKQTDGNLEFLGRLDDQVKVRGFRIELKEIENHLSAFSEIEHACVLTSQTGSSELEIVAYFTTRGALNAPNVEQFKEHLSASLPDYMIPNAFVRLDAFPLTVNGKIDQKALPAPDRQARGARSEVLPVNSIEQALADFWSEVLSVDHVFSTDTLQTLGGSSLDAVQFLTRCREKFGPVICLEDVFTGQTIAQLAGKIHVSTALHSPQAPLRSYQIEGDTFPVSHQQNGVWHLEKLTPDSLAYNAQCLIRMTGKVKIKALQNALNLIVERHEIFRTTFHEDERGNAYQQVHLPVPAQLDVRALDTGMDSPNLWRAIDEEVKKPFKTNQLPLARWVLFSLNDDTFGLLHIEHHLVHDGWSANIFLSELLDAYEAFAGGGKPNLASVPAQYRNYVGWQLSDDAEQTYEKQLAYWTKQLSGANFNLSLPTDFPRPETMSFRGKQDRVVLSGSLLQKLKNYCEVNGHTDYTVLLAVFHILLSRYTGQNDLLTGSAVANRKSRDAEQLPGMFVNSIVVRADLSGQPSFADYLERLRTVLSNAYDNEEVPFERVVRALDPQRDASRNPIFQIGFSYHNSQTPELHRDDLIISLYEAYSNQSAKFDMEVVILPRSSTDVEASALTLLWNYATDLYRPENVARMQANYIALLKECLAGPELSVDRFSGICTDERKQLIENWGAASRETSDDDVSVLHLIENFAKVQPDRTAVIDQDVTLSYSELVNKASYLASNLTALGVKKEMLVGVCMERSAYLIVALLAVWQAGGAYLPIDPSLPAARKSFIINDSAPALIICSHSTQQSCEELLSKQDATALLLFEDEVAKPWTERPVNTCSETNANGSDLAYVIYTSGSTGQPKGVQIEHRQISRLMSTCQPLFQFQPSDIWSFFHSYAFDFSVWEIWGALATGGTITVVPEEARHDPTLFYSLCCKHGVTILSQTPSAFRIFMEAQAETDVAHKLRTVVFGGEALQPAMLCNWFTDPRNSRCDMVNMYGITETTVHVSYYKLSTDDVDRKVEGSPIGRQLGDLSLYVLDQNRQPVPLGAIGEMYVGGAGVARGYLNRSELNEERFISSPFSPTERLYRTGDLAKYSANGTLLYLGRNDDQVKIRGYRIELGEIEAALISHTDIQHAVVCSTAERSDEPKLVAYFVPTTTGHFIDGRALQAFLRDILPSYMVPTAYVRLEQLPLTSNGKLDRNELTNLVPSLTDTKKFVRPEDGVEALLAKVWADVLQIGLVGRFDNFFELGGHSLLATRIQAQMRSKGYQLPAIDLLRKPVLKELAEHIQPIPPQDGKLITKPENSQTDVSRTAMSLSGLSQSQLEDLSQFIPGGHGNVKDVYPLTPLQEGFYFHHQLAKSGDPYLLWSLMAFQNKDALQNYLDALQNVMNRHDILRTLFVSEGLPNPLQVVLKNVRLQSCEILAENLCSTGDIAQRLRQQFDPRTYQIKLHEPSLTRVFYCFDEHNQRWLALKLFHHIIDDNTSLKQLNAEMKAYMTGAGESLPEPAQFGDFISFQLAQGRKDEAQNFLKELFAGFQSPSLPFGIVDAEVHGADLESVVTITDKALTTSIRVLARRYEVSTASVFHFVWALIVARCSGQDDVCFATILLGRLQGLENAERILGPFINTLPLRINLADRDVAEGLLGVHSILLKLLEHDTASLADAIDASGVERPTPLLTSVLNFRHAELMSDGSQGASHRDLPGATYLDGQYGTNYPFNLTVDDEGSCFKIELQAPPNCYAPALLDMVLTSLEHLAQQTPETAKNPALQLARYSAHQLEKLKALSEGPLFTQSPKTMHGTFEECASRHGDRVAIVSGPAELTYDQLNQQANKLAKYLLERGVRTGSRVAVCLSEGLNTVVALLAVLKSGGAYVPLDPAHPPERLGYQLEDSSPLLVLCDDGSVPSLEPSQTRDTLVLLDRDHAAWQQYSGDNVSDELTRPVSREDLAYVIYTSGTTGRPKGVMVPHKGPANLVEWFRQQKQVTENDRVLLSTSITFDISVVEVFATLSCGACLVVSERSRLLEGTYLVETIRQHSVTVCQFVPSLLGFFLSCEGVETCTSVRSILCGGEAFPSHLAQRCFEVLGHVRLQNLYGPTEASIYCTKQDIDPSANYPAVLPIGQPIAGMKMYVLDRHMTLVPRGVAGDLYVAGPGVAMGYLNRPKLTPERFVPNPLVQGEQLYRTGDIGRYMNDGAIEYLGRDDFQIKVRGYRIEPGEIEHALCQCDGVTNAVVISWQDEAGEALLVTYVCTTNDASSLDTAALRSSLGRQLPDYMVPSLYVQLASLPLSANGKIDRKQLPEPSGINAPASQTHKGPQTPLEEALAQIWAEVLQLEHVGMQDNFFDIGGHSLRATRIIARMRDVLGIEVPLRVFFERPTIEQTLYYIFEELEAAEYS
ncbi:non-ribosomal peptide synthetase [Pseudovibrio sp. Tun.PSC04-5.I4]|uniref:non-ribosomal peptide synthetase n=1 Tax=Pseudovibrio sp. Tun.PSC04-5.I4 TaxID=1798213 RepID=UPI00088CFE64|nr:non-ribosomal peptide synthetase [Pseudovibrio sp. Tun.PSC04-5.I4]SDQ31306.1 amino acid adenylation domain-containing protein [Pseudovibrio sp. Tun.PSC04-5.I4]